jgi:hypothetical protein
MHSEKKPRMGECHPVSFRQTGICKNSYVIIKADKNTVLETFIAEKAQSYGIEQGKSHKSCEKE